MKITADMAIDQFEALTQVDPSLRPNGNSVISTLDQNTKRQAIRAATLTFLAASLSACNTSDDTYSSPTEAQALIDGVNEFLGTDFTLETRPADVIEALNSSRASLADDLAAANEALEELSQENTAIEGDNASITAESQELSESLETLIADRASLVDDLLTVTEQRDNFSDLLELASNLPFKTLANDGEEISFSSSPNSTVFVANVSSDVDRLDTTIIGSGSGNLTFSFADPNDEVVLATNSRIDNYSSINVLGGNVDLANTEIAEGVDVTINSGVSMTIEQFLNSNSIKGLSDNSSLQLTYAVVEGDPSDYNEFFGVDEATWNAALANPFTATGDFSPEYSKMTQGLAEKISGLAPENFSIPVLDLSTLEASDLELPLEIIEVEREFLEATFTQVITNTYTVEQLGQDLVDTRTEHFSELLEASTELAEGLLSIAQSLLTLENAAKEINQYSDFNFFDYAYDTQAEANDKLSNLPSESLQSSTLADIVQELEGLLSSENGVIGGSFDGVLHPYSGMELSMLYNTIEVSVAGLLAFENSDAIQPDDSTSEARERVEMELAVNPNTFTGSTINYNDIDFFNLMDVEAYADNQSFWNNPFNSNSFNDYDSITEFQLIIGDYLASNNDFIIPAGYTNFLKGKNQFSLGGSDVFEITFVNDYNNFFTEAENDGGFLGIPTQGLDEFGDDGLDILDLAIDFSYYLPISLYDDMGSSSDELAHLLIHGFTPDITLHDGSIDALPTLSDNPYQAVILETGSENTSALEVYLQLGSSDTLDFDRQADYVLGSSQGLSLDDIRVNEEFSMIYAGDFDDNQILADNYLSM